MLTVDTILNIIRLLLEIANKRMDHMTDEQWERHEQRIEGFYTLLDKVTAKLT